MANSKRVTILAEMAELQKQNSEANITAIYVGCLAKKTLCIRNASSGRPHYSGS